MPLASAETRQTLAGRPVIARARGREETLGGVFQVPRGDKEEIENTPNLLACRKRGGERLLAQTLCLWASKRNLLKSRLG